MTNAIQDLETRVWELEQRMRCSSYSQQSELASRRATLLRQLELAKQEAQRETERERQQQRRRAVTAILMPTENIWRPFIRTLAEDAIEDVLRYNVTVAPSLLSKSSASVMRRTIFAAPVLSEEGYIAVKHELAHVIDARADGRQHRYSDSENHLVSPMGECAAWRWSVDHSLVWTFVMQTDMARCIDTYKASATPAELQAIEEIKVYGVSRIAPAPDSFEGRLCRLKRIQSEVKQAKVEQEIRRAMENSPIERNRRRLQQAMTAR
jgi:hypothetical protein